MATESTLVRLMREHQRDVWRFLRALGCEPALADDVTQEAFIAAYRKPPVERSDAETGAWLRATARNIYLNHAKRERRQVASLEAAEAAWAALTPVNGSDERLEALEDCLEQLPARARTALKLRYHEQLDGPELAGRIETTEQATRALLSRARKTLRECIERKVRQ